MGFRNAFGILRCQVQRVAGTQLIAGKNHLYGGGLVCGKKQGHLVHRHPPIVCGTVVYHGRRRITRLDFFADLWYTMSVKREKY